MAMSPYRYFTEVLGYTPDEAQQAIRMTQHPYRQTPAWNVSSEDLVRELILRMTFDKEDIARRGLLETPDRVVASWQELFFGYAVPDEEQFVKDLLTAFPEPGADEMVVVKKIRVFSFCEHHLLPFFGWAAVGYLPQEGRVLGLSKLARLVQFYAARLSTQERICNKVTAALVDHFGTKGAGCVVKAQHLCMCARGACEPDAVTVTSGLWGKFRDEPQTRAEFLNLAGD